MKNRQKDYFMNNDRLKFRTPYYLPNPDGINEFVGFAHWDAITGRPNMMVVWDNDEQCTGLKDKNGNLIYECDLLEAGGRRYVVCWAHHGFVMRFTPDSASSYPLGGTDLFEIIGNIHEQKEEE